MAGEGLEKANQSVIVIEQGRRIADRERRPNQYD